MSSIKLKGSSSGEAIITTASDGSSVILDKKLDLDGQELILDSDSDTSIHASTDDQIDFKIGGTDKAHFDTSGNFYVGSIANPWTATSGINVRLGATFPLTTTNAGINAIFNRNTSTGTLVEYKQAGNVVGSISVTASNTAYNTSSDYRLKENIDYSFDATARLKELKPCRFNWIKDDTNTALDGFLAHEVSSIVPEAITGTKDAVDDNGDAVYQGIDQSKLVPLLVKTIQEQQAVIEDLQSRVTILEG